MAENHASRKISRNKSFFSEEKPRQLAAFQQVRRGLVYLSGESRPSPAQTCVGTNQQEVYLSGESRPSPAI